MKSIKIEVAGGPDVLRVVDVETPTPRTGEIRIKQEAIGINFIDTYQRSGLYKIPLPAVLGMEGAGTVEAVGKQIDAVMPDQ